MAAALTAACSAQTPALSSRPPLLPAPPLAQPAWWDAAGSAASRPDVLSQARCTARASGRTSSSQEGRTARRGGGLGQRGPHPGDPEEDRRARGLRRGRPVDLLAHGQRRPVRGDRRQPAPLHLHAPACEAVHRLPGDSQAEMLHAVRMPAAAYVIKWHLGHLLANEDLRMVPSEQVCAPRVLAEGGQAEMHRGAHCVVAAALSRRRRRSRRRGTSW